MSMLNKIKKRLQSEAETHSETQRELEAMKMQLLELQQMVGENPCLTFSLSFRPHSPVFLYSSLDSHCACCLRGGGCQLICS